MEQVKSERANKKLKFLDLFAGVPLIFILGVFRKKKHFNPDSNIRNIALLRTAAIGDTVLISAIIKDLKEAMPDVKITLFTGASNYEIGMIIGADRVIKLPITKVIKALFLCRESGRFDVWIDFGQWPRYDALISYFSSADLKIGFKTGAQHRHYGYDITVNHSDEIHELENFRNLVRVLDVKAGNYPVLDIMKPVVKNDNIIIHMFPGGSKAFLKEYPPENWIELIRYLNSKGILIELTGSPGDRLKIENFLNNFTDRQNIHNLAGLYDLKNTAEILSLSKLVISVDTGILHMASAMQCNLIGLFGPTSPHRWGPLNSNSAVLRSSSCKECISLGFESKCTDNRCMRLIKPQEIINAIKGFGFNL